MIIGQRIDISSPIQNGDIEIIQLKITYRLHKIGQVV